MRPRCRSCSQEQNPRLPWHSRNQNCTGNVSYRLRNPGESPQRCHHCKRGPHHHHFRIPRRFRPYRLLPGHVTPRHNCREHASLDRIAPIVAARSAAFHIWIGQPRKRPGAVFEARAWGVAVGLLRRNDRVLLDTAPTPVRLALQRTRRGVRPLPGVPPRYGRANPGAGHGSSVLRPGASKRRHRTGSGRSHDRYQDRTGRPSR